MWTCFSGSCLHGMCLLNARMVKKIKKCDWIYCTILLLEISCNSAIYLDNYFILVTDILCTSSQTIHTTGTQKALVLQNDHDKWYLLALFIAFGVFNSENQRHKKKKKNSFLKMHLGQRLLILMALLLLIYPTVTLHWFNATLRIASNLNVHLLSGCRPYCHWSLLWLPFQAFF